MSFSIKGRECGSEQGLSPEKVGFSGTIRILGALVGEKAKKGGTRGADNKAGPPQSFHRADHTSDHTSATPAFSQIQTRNMKAPRALSF